ncbi:MAG: TolC family protein [Planctomycetota bacterium]
MKLVLLFAGIIISGLIFSGCFFNQKKSYLPRPASLLIDALDVKSKTYSGKPLEVKRLTKEKSWSPEYYSNNVDQSPRLIIGNSLNLRKALSLALMNSPELGKNYWEIRVAEARKLQSSLLPNPELDVEVEGVSGTAPGMSGVSSAETTLAIGQLIELGGKRGKRKRVATIEHGLSAWDFESKRLDILTKTTQDFIDLLAAQKKLEFAKDMLSLAEKSFFAAKKRVDVGKVLPIEGRKSRVFLIGRKIEFRRAASNLTAVRVRLASNWGDSSSGVFSADGILEKVHSIPSYKLILTYLNQNPDIGRWATELNHRKAALSLEKSKRIPDIELSGGVKHENETKDRSYVFGLSLPLPLFDRNQGSIDEAKHELKLAEIEEHAVTIAAKQQLSEIYQSLQATYMDIDVLNRDVIPRAKDSLNAAQVGYTQGKFDYLEVLDAQRTVVEIQEQYIDSLVDYHKSVVDMERLIGTSLKSISPLTQN